MRACLTLLLCTAALGCGSSTSNPDSAAPSPDFALPTGGSVDLAGPVDMAKKMGSDGGMLETLTVNNTLAWCTVTVTIGNGTPTTFTDATRNFMVAAGATVNLQADPLPNFIAVKWTGVTTMSGDKATYVMTSAATQMVTACCAHTNGTGC
jgi:hypothetical protein